MSTVSSQTGVASCSDTRCEVTADVSSSVKNYLRLVLVDELFHNLGVTVGSIVFQKRILNQVNLFSSVFETFLSQVIDVVSDQYCADLSIFADVLSQLLAFSEKLKGNILDLALSLFSKYPNVLIS